MGLFLLLMMSFVFNNDLKKSTYGMLLSLGTLMIALLLGLCCFFLFCLIRRQVLPAYIHTYLLTRIYVESADLLLLIQLLALCVEVCVYLGVC